MAKDRDLFEVWRDTGELDNVLNFIRDCSKKLIKQGEICEHLGINEATFSRLKKKHPEIKEAIEKSKLDLKKDLADAMYKLAVGFEIIEETQDVEDRGIGEKQKRKIHRTKKEVPPDFKAIVYLLTKKFGREYSQRYEDILLAEKKIEESKEEWLNVSKVEHSNDED